MMNTTTNPYRIAAALAAHCGEDWGIAAFRYAGHHVAGNATCDCGRLHVSTCPVLHRASIDEWAKLLPDEMAAAYLADCARRGVEPGALPSLSWTSADGREEWKVVVYDPAVEVSISVGKARLSVWSDGHVHMWSVCEGATIADLAKAVDLATVAARAMGLDTAGGAT